MATVRFLISKKGERPKVTLRLRVSDNVKLQTVVPGVLGYREWWSNAKQTHLTKFVNPMLLPEVNAINRQLAKLSATILARFAATPVEDVDAAWLSDEVEKALYPDKQSSNERPSKILQAMEDYIATSDTRLMRSGKPISESTLEQYRQTRNHLQGYLRDRRIKDIEVQNLDKLFYDDFVAYLFGLGYRPNTVGKHIKCLKAVINSLPLAQRVGCEFVEGGKCIKITEEVDSVYLTEDELSRLAHYDFGRRSSLARVRDEFLLLAWTGCRYSDLPKLNKDNIVTANGYQYFKLVQQKTGAKVTIPILPIARSVLERYDYVMPACLSDQKFNDHLKELCRIAGIDDDVVINRTEYVKKRGRAALQVVAHHYKKWECVTAHTARRSFATNMYKRNFPTLMIMAITGHKTEKAFLTYIKVSEDENAERMMAQFMAQESGML